MNTVEFYEAQFDKIVSDLGNAGRLDLDALEPEESIFFFNLKESAQANINFWRDHADNLPNRHKPQIYFDFVDNLSLNALAFKDEYGNGYIGLNHGSVLLLLDLFNRMLSRSDILTQIGNSSIEVNPVALPRLFASYAQIQQFTNDFTLKPTVVPKDQERSEHAAFLTEMAIWHLIYHEMAHLLCGHVDLINQKSGQNFIVEFNSNKDSIIPALTYKVIEWQADRLASAYQTSILIDLCASQDTFPLIRKSYSPPDSGIYINCFFAIYSMYRLIDDVVLNSGKGYSAFYPTFFERMNSNGIEMMGMLKRRGTIYKDEILKPYLKDTTFSVVRALELVSERLLDREGVKEFNDVMKNDYWNNYLSEFIPHWNNEVQPQLLPLSHINIVEKYTLYEIKTT